MDEALKTYRKNSYGLSCKKDAKTDVARLRRRVINKKIINRLNDE
jgi:hypothetical protein